MENYRELAIRTECEYTEQLLERAKGKVRLTHAAFGLGGEVAELRDAIASEERVNILEELGDFYWYLAIIENVCDTNFIFDDGSVIEGTVTEMVDDLEFQICRFMDALKRAIFYGTELSNDDLLFLGDDISLSLGNLCVKFESSVDEVRAANINKLKARYGDKFSEDRAVNRDLQNESNTLKENLNG
jgi:NTP pyrophosphatase (non-canonical NTP hydrolase)